MVGTLYPSTLRTYDAITGANGLAPCRADDVLCQEADVFNGTYGGNWGAATADFIARSGSKAAKHVLRPRVWDVAIV